MSGPNSDPAVSSQQSYRTPREFLDRVWRKFGVFPDFDLACTFGDRVTPRGFCFDRGQDALALPWPRTPDGGAAWCNPPFNRSSAFARVASESPHCRTLMLIPASVGSSWFAEHVNGKALVVFLRPRIVFLQPDGTPVQHFDKKTGEWKDSGINRDCMLLGWGWAPGYHCEDWRTW